MFLFSGTYIAVEVLSAINEQHTFIKQFFFIGTYGNCFWCSRQSFGEPCGYQYERHTQNIPFAIANFEEWGGSCYMGGGLLMPLYGSNPPPPLPRLKDGQGRIVIPVGSLKFYAGENVYYACVRQAVPHTDRYTIYLF